MQSKRFAPGARILVRDAEWLVRRVDRTSTGGQALSVVGLSELVRNKEAMFLTEVEPSIEVLDPAETRLVADPSPGFRDSLLYIESLLRQTPPTDENLYVGHRAAMDPVPYQLDPAIQALEQTRQRILIADAVGLGKTLEAGILLAELIRRGRGKRILVLAVKSMLTQFQKELWSRFAIPLTRLDSVGLQRVRARIPTNHNPFYYYDKAIISIDTLKQDAEYRTYLENAYWDVIVIDEAHNVAERGGTSSMRARLAKLLSHRSDTLIMLSATPHDGKAKSFASLMRMLDPTAIADPEDYGPDDIKGLFVRRFKKDIQDQVERAFKERTICKARVEASPAEERAHDALVEAEFTRLDQRRGGTQLFRTTLEKALFSSPAACLQTLRNRIARLEREADPAWAADIAALREIERHVQAIGATEFAKYQELLQVVADPDHGFGWTGRDPADRLVIFTERIETLKFLRDHLPRDLGLKDEQVEILHGSMSDVDQQRVVEAFGQDEAPVRLLLASDVASEGINLHYLSHRMIHFDIPWSLMVFQQRNGRIDRYGQERTPHIVYLVTESRNPKIRGDTRILELLIEKDEQAVRNIGDPSAWMGVYDVDAEEALTAEAIETGLTPEAFEARVEEHAGGFDPLALLLGDAPPPIGERAEERVRTPPTLFEDDYAYLAAALPALHASTPVQAELNPVERRVALTAPAELRARFRTLPREAWPDDDVFVLSADKDAVQAEIVRCRKDELAWPRVQYLWELHPILQWVNDKVVAAFGRHEAPVLTGLDGLAPGEVAFVISGLIPNRKGHPLIHRWFAVTFRDGRLHGVESFEDLARRLGLGTRTLANPDRPFDPEPVRALLPQAVERARRWMSEARREFEARIDPKLNQELAELDRLRGRQHRQLDLEYEGSRLLPQVIQGRKDRRRREIDAIFDEYVQWVEDTLCTEDSPYIQVVAVGMG